MPVRDELTSRGRAVRVAFQPLPYDLALQMMMMTPVLEINCGPPHHKCLV